MRDQDDIPLDPSTLIRLGKISAVTLSPPRCRVRIGDPDTDDGQIESPPVRWIAVRSGKTRSWSPPSEGEEVVLLCPDGQIGNGVAICGLINDDHPAAGATLAEVTTYADGASIGYDPVSHTLSALLPANGMAMITAPAGVKIIGNLMVTESITAQKNLASGTGATGTFSTAGGQTVTVTDGIIVNIY
jgi:phage baseplate assembly protein V